MSRNLNLKNFSLLPISKSPSEIPVDGILQPIPKFCKNKFGQACIDHYEKFSGGSAQCPHGFSTVKLSSDGGKSVVWTGIKVKNHHDVGILRKRESVKELRVYTQDVLEEIFEENLRILDRLDSAFDEKLSHAKEKLAIATKQTHSAFHEIRPLNAEIKASVNRLRSTLGSFREKLQVHEYDALLYQLNGVSYSSELTSIRMDQRDFVLNSDAIVRSTKVPINIRKEIDRLYAIFKFLLKREDLLLTYKIPDTTSIRCNLAFKLLLFVVLENAIKYSPFKVGQEILIDLDKSDSKNHLTVVSLGPKVDDDEKEDIFREFFRSRNVASLPGTGMGLYVAHVVASALGLTIGFDQNPKEAFTLEGRAYFETTMFIGLPKD